jgi:hypothetical protein
MGQKAEAQKEFDQSLAIFAPWALGKNPTQDGFSAATQ